MASLTESAVVARKAIKYGAIGFVAITILWFTGGALIDYYKSVNPPAPPLPQTGFGKVAAVEFPEETGRPKITLELPTRDIPSFPTQIKIYEMVQKRSSFLDTDRSVETAASLNFLFKPTKESSTIYVWSNQDELESSLKMNIVNGKFTLTRKWENKPELAILADFRSEKDVATRAESILKQVDLDKKDITGSESLTYLRVNETSLIEALSLSGADFVQVDFNRNNIEEIDEETEKVLSSYPFYQTEPEKGLIRIIITGSREANEKAIYMENNYREINYDRFSTYPIKTGEQAWNELEAGEGYVTNNSPKEGNTKIRRIFLAYYDGDNEKYSMPIYVFLGDQDFIAYISAVDSEWIK